LNKQQFDTAVRKAIERHRAETVEQREKIYRSARSTLRRHADDKDVRHARLEEAISEIEASFRRKSPPAGSRSNMARLSTGLSALLFGMVIGAVVTAATTGLAIPEKSGTDMSPALRELDKIYQEQADLVPVATNFLREVVDSIVRRQGSDRASLEPIAKKFTPLAQFDPELSEKLPKSLPPGTLVTVRATATNLKVLMNWTLCGVVAISNPELVDRARNKRPTIGCTYFGFWTAGAEKW